MNNSLELLKKEVNDYDVLYKNYIDSMNLCKDVTKYLEKLRDKYKKFPTYSLEKEIKEWELQEKDYFDLFNEYQCEMVKYGYDSNHAEKVEFIQLSDLFNKLTDEIKKIEKKSKKFGSKNEIGTNRVETLNAEGRKKYIHEYLLNDYNSLVEQKKAILPKYRDLYKKYIDSSYVELEEPENLEEIDVVSSLDEGAKLEDKYFNNMTIDEKINYYKERINNILNAKNTGKKVYITVYGKNYYVPKKYEYLLRDYLKEIKKLNELKNENESKVIISNDVDDNYDEIKSFIDEKSNNKFVISDVDRIYSVDDFEPLKVEFTNVSSDDRDIWSDSSLIPANKDNKELAVAKPASIISLSDKDDESQIIKVKTVKKAKNKLGLKKKIIAAAAAIALAVTTAISVFALSNFGKKDNHIDEDNSVSLENLVTKHPIDSLNDENIDNKDIDDNHSSIDSDDYNKKEIVAENDFKMSFRIGDNVNIKDNSYIYDNVYDAMNRTNGYNPYFENSKEREVKGVFVELNDSYSYYENQEDIDAALSDGGIVRSYVVGNSDGYEGAYNSLDVKSLQKVGNRL